MYHYYLRYKFQKNRSFIRWKRPKLRFGNSALVCLSSGFISMGGLKRFCIVFKKRLRVKKNMTRYWVRLCYNHIFTKKSANTRMGKGKGSIKSYGCYYHSGNSIVEFFNIRNGLLRKLLQYVRVRCAFRVWATHYKTGTTNIGKLCFKNASITRYFFRKKKTFPSLLKNFKFIIFKLMLDNRFHDSRRIKRVFRKIKHIGRRKRRFRYLGRHWLGFFLFKRNGRFSLKRTRWKHYRFLRLPYWRTLRTIRKRSKLKHGFFLYGFFTKFFFSNISKKMHKLILLLRVANKFFCKPHSFLTKRSFPSLKVKLSRTRYTQKIFFRKSRRSLIIRNIKNKFINNRRRILRRLIRINKFFRSLFFTYKFKKLLFFNKFFRRKL